MMKIGAMVESFRSGFRGGVEKAAALGIEGVQAYATFGELDVTKVTDAQLKECLDIVKSNGMVFSAICGDFGKGFANPETNPEYIEKSKRVLELALKLECNVVTTHIGTVPEEENATKEIMRKACRELAEYGDSINASFAVETGPEKGRVLGEFLDSLGAKGVKVNFDPANLVMCVDDRPEEALRYLGKYVVHTHAKDGIMLKKKVDYAFSLGQREFEYEALLERGYTYRELPLGEGDVNFDIYLPALKATGFDGFLTIEREVGDNPEKDIALAVSFLKERVVRL